MIWISLLMLGCTKAPEAGPSPADSGVAAASDTAATDTASGAADTDLSAEVHTLTVQELSAWIDGSDDFLLINVHTPYAGDIPGTDVDIPYYDTELLTDTIGTDLDTLVVVYCKTGPMSAQASADLVALGYRAVYDLPEGMVGWEAAGYELSP